MAEAWYRKHPEVLDEVRRRVFEIQPNLKFIDTVTGVLFKGTFLIQEGGRLYEEFEVEVGLSSKSAVSIPVVREVGGRIPHMADLHHVNPDGTLCVVLPDEYWYCFPDGLHIAEYISGPLRSHLSGQALVLRGEPWPQRDWAHGVEGQLAFYCEVLGTNDRQAAARLMLMLATGKVKGHRECPCGSGRIVRECHQEGIWKASVRIPREVVMRRAKGLQR